jgi:two-component system chemotaxis response regulator CheV
MSGISNSVEQMTQAHLRNVQQLAVFYTGHNNIYAINIAKVKAFIITEEIAINDTPSDTPVISGIGTIRGEPVTLINLDAWLGLTPLKTEEYKLILFCEFNHKKIGFLVKDMLDIVEKTTEELRHTEETNSKITYTTYVKVDDKDELCTVFNAEQLLRDIGWTDER